MASRDQTLDFVPILRRIMSRPRGSCNLRDSLHDMLRLGFQGNRYDFDVAAQAELSQIASYEEWKKEGVDQIEELIAAWVADQLKHL